MTGNLIRVIAGLALALGTVSAQSRECASVSFPDQTQVEGAALKLNGLGLRQATILKINVYVAALYVAQPTKDVNAILAAGAPKQLVMQFVRDVGRSDLNKGWDEGFENNARNELAALRERIEAFKGLITDMKTGDRLALTYKPGVGVQVAIKGAVKGTVAGDDFARALFSIWLGPKPPNADLKAGLLGGECG